MKARAYTPAWKENVSEGTRRGRISQLARKRVLALVSKGDVERLIESRTVVESLRPFANIYAVEILELVEARGGPDHLSPQERMLVEDVATLGMIARALRAIFLQTGDHEVASKVSTLLGQRRSTLATLGLERIAHEVPSLEGYVASRAAENGSGATHADSPRSEANDV